MRKHYPSFRERVDKGFWKYQVKQQQVVVQQQQEGPQNITKNLFETVEIGATNGI
jgi:hypothetical protein